MSVLELPSSALLANDYTTSKFTTTLSLQFCKLKLSNPIWELCLRTAAGAWVLYYWYLVIGKCWTAEMCLVFSVYHYKHLISDDHNWMWLVKFFSSLCWKLYFYHFIPFTSFLTASKRHTKTVSLIFSYLHREAIPSRLPDSWFGSSKYKSPKCSDKEPRPHFNDHKLNQHLYEAALILIENWWDEIVAAAPAWLYLYVGHLIKYHKYTFCQNWKHSRLWQLFLTDKTNWSFLFRYQ